MVFLLLGDVNSLFNAECLYRQVPVFIVLFHYKDILRGKFPEKQDIAPILLAPGSRKYSYAIEERTKKREKP